MDNTVKLTPPNTLRFADFAPAYVGCPCRSCVHRSRALRTDDGKVVKCARYRPDVCRGCPESESAA